MRYINRAEIKIPLLFLIISALWIVGSDKLLLTIYSEATVPELTEIQTIKGLLFIVCVTFLIHSIIKSFNKRFRLSEAENKQSNTSAILLSANDLTSQKEAILALSQRETLLNQILDSITDGFFLLTPALVVMKANKFFKEMTGLAIKDIEGQKLADLFPGTEKTFSYQRYVGAINSHTPVHFEVHSKKLNKWFEVSAYPFNGNLSVFFRDISKEKEDQLQRQQHLHNLLSLINNTDDLMWSVDCDFKYFVFNEPYGKNYKRIFGEEIYVGKCALNYKQGAVHVQKWRDLYQRALHGEKFVADMDFVIEDKCYFTTVRLNPIYDENNHIIGAGCFMQDITERKLHLRKIEQQNEQLKQIAFITSHQVRVPLANILGLAEILDKEDPLSDANCKIIEHIKTSAKELDKSIINMVQQTVYADD